LLPFFAASEIAP